MTTPSNTSYSLHLILAPHPINPQNLKSALGEITLRAKKAQDIKLAAAKQTQQVSSSPSVLYCVLLIDITQLTGVNPQVCCTVSFTVCVTH